MKAIIISLGFIVGLGLGLWPGVGKPKPFLWRITALSITTVMIFLALLPHTAGSFRDAVIVGRMDSSKIVPVLIHSDDIQNWASDSLRGLSVITVKGENGIPVTIHANSNDAAAIRGHQSVILDIRREGADNTFECVNAAASNPLITIPYIIGLEERARNLYFHVPMSWIAILAYIYALIYGIKYLSSKNLDDDLHSSSAAALGTIFCALATITGSIWAKFNWGSFWNWDPRQTSIFVLLLIYAAYFVLRASVENERQRAKLSGAYSVIGGLSSIFFVYIAPRLYEGLHPGSAGDTNAGPVISPQADALNPIKQIILSMAFAGFTILFFWLLGLAIRIRRLEISSSSEED